MFGAGSVRKIKVIVSFLHEVNILIFFSILSLTNTGKVNKLEKHFLALA